MTKCMQSRRHQYIFEPVCASVLLRRNTSKEPLRSRNTPRIEGQVQLEPMSLRLSQVCVKNWCFFFVFFLNSINLLARHWKSQRSKAKDKCFGFLLFHMFYLNTYMWLNIRLWIRFECVSLSLYFRQVCMIYLWFVPVADYPNTFGITSISSFEQIFWHSDI